MPIEYALSKSPMNSARIVKIFKDAIKDIRDQSKQDRALALSNLEEFKAKLAEDGLHREEKATYTAAVVDCLRLAQDCKGSSLKLLEILLKLKKDLSEGSSFGDNATSDSKPIDVSTITSEDLFNE